MICSRSLSISCAIIVVFSNRMKMDEDEKNKFFSGRFSSYSVISACELLKTLH